MLKNGMRLPIKLWSKSAKVPPPSINSSLLQLYKQKNQICQQKKTGVANLPENIENMLKNKYIISKRNITSENCAFRNEK
jgi:hypothetical protein